ncbi:MAG: outer membrane beta-barrel protein [Thiofilum sp.]|uniref:outer membrane beta-barrel protein n=1 Tax=Thiofilum sp. TaxID=2212733 RepID=UPI0025E83A80|nr:outer membrane beta-barrel protein [Thiofilum sp.]MBK8451727.1 outer membrane beta-barrel protein [Thiofilum sp.]
MKTTRQHWAAWLVPAAVLLSNPIYAADTTSPFDSLLGLFKPSPQSKATLSGSRANANYIGANIGSANTEGFCTQLENCETSSNAWKLYAGVPLQNGLLLDGAYVNFGEQQGKATNGSTTKAQRSGYTAAGVVTLPMSDSLHLYGKGGMLWWTSEESHSNSHQAVDGKSTFYGIGADYRLNGNLGVRAEWEHYSDVGSEQLSDRNINLLSVGVSMSSL